MSGAVRGVGFSGCSFLLLLVGRRMSTAVSTAVVATVITAAITVVVATMSTKYSAPQGFCPSVKSVGPLYCVVCTVWSVKKRALQVLRKHFQLTPEYLQAAQVPRSF
ncbi:unnamed protein product [Discosporangium mesarthrocarpum]